MALWGPVLHYDNYNNITWLFYSESTPAQTKSSGKSNVGGNILYKTSKDYGQTWSEFNEILSWEDEGNTAKVTANKLIQVNVPTGTGSEFIIRWILPFWQENNTQYNSTQPSASRVLISDDFGMTWNVYGLNDDHYLIENTVASIKDESGRDTGTILQLFRSGGSPLYSAYSYDYGITWTKAEKTNIPNPNSKVFVFYGYL